MGQQRAAGKTKCGATSTGQQRVSGAVTLLLAAAAATNVTPVPTTAAAYVTPIPITAAPAVVWVSAATRASVVWVSAATRASVVWVSAATGASVARIGRVAAAISAIHGRLRRVVAGGLPLGLAGCLLEVEPSLVFLVELRDPARRDCRLVGRRGVDGRWRLLLVGILVVGGVVVVLGRPAVIVAFCCADCQLGNAVIIARTGKVGGGVKRIAS